MGGGDWLSLASSATAISSAIVASSQVTKTATCALCLFFDTCEVVVDIAEFATSKHLTMSNRQSRRSTGNAIRGPQSALTDFLASHNISAQQIHQDYQRRVAEAERQQAQNAVEEDKENESDGDEDPVERKKRKRKEEMAIMKIKQSKEFKRRKHEAGSDAEDDDALARNMLKKAQPLPGQLSNCEACSKRFTVTPYCKTGSSGGLLCTKCSKEVKDEEKKAQALAKKKKATPKQRRRQTESDRMMGDVKPGAKSLVEHCAQRVANVLNDIEEFGDLPQNLLDRLSQILSQRRIITPRTLQLFLQPGIDRIAIYDCGKLETEDFGRIFAMMPDLEIVDLRMAGQLKNDSLLYMIEKNPKIKHLQLGAVNLISDETWVELFRRRGPQLETLKLSELNDSLNDHSMSEMGRHCKSLRRLKLASCSHITEASIEWIAQLQNLEHLSLAVATHASPELLVELIKAVGPKLKTLSLKKYIEADDSVLAAIKEHCTLLTKLRLTGTTECTDAAFAQLFDNNSPNPPIPFVDLSSNRDINGTRADNPQINSIGFGSQALLSLMQHSGRLLQKLDLSSNRHISYQALLDVFDGEKQYPMLKDMDLSFVTFVDDTVMQGIFRSCPSLTKLAVFACFSARGAMIPPGIAVVGLPNAQDSIVVNSDAMIGL